MKQHQFETAHEAEWRAFETTLLRLERSGRVGRRAAKTPAADSDPGANEAADTGSGFPADYRRLCSQLALARERHYSNRLIDRLAGLTLRAHQQLYRAAPGRLAAIKRFFSAEFPALVRAEAALVGLCALLFYLPLLAMAAATYTNPALIYSLLDPPAVNAAEQMYRPENRIAAERPADSDVLMFGFYIYNNIGIGFRTFAGGLLFGVGTIAILIFNGVFIGALSGYLTGLGYQQTFYPFVIAHGAFELTAIVLAGAAGMRLGLALLAPGRYSRGQALTRAAAGVIKLVYGVAALLLLAAFIEAFWSSKDTLPVALRYAVGAGCWLLLGVYLLFAGRGGKPQYGGDDNAA